MSAYHSRMGRDALENGPHELRLVYCRDCSGTGCAGRWEDCECCFTCGGTGEIDAEEQEDET